MGGGGGKAPTMPDYTGLAEKQAQEQNRLIDKQTQANRPTQINPFGSITWTQDAAGNWVQNTRYDPTITSNIQALQKAQAANIAGMGAYDPSQVSDIQKFNPYQMTTGQYDAAGADKYADAFTKQLLARVSPQQEVDRKAMATQLRLQGLQPGSEAYDRAYKNLLTSQGDVNSQAALQGMLYGLSESRNDYNTRLGYDAAAAANNAQNQTIGNATQQQEWQQYLQNYMAPYQAISAGNDAIQGMTPSFGGFTPAGVGQAADIVGAAQQTYAQQMQNYNDKKQSKEGKGKAIGSTIGGIAGTFFGPVGTMVGSAAGGAIGGAFSDATLKEDIETIPDEEAFEKLLDVLPAKWKWSGVGIEDSGVIAQHIADIMPDLIEESRSGKLRVNYTGLFALLQGAFRHLAKELNNVR